ncbi:MAG: polysaccharide biosynthesis tyrosine autokinase [Roseofilum sp. Belize BBD 4]|uniref:GumC family protein n=1 Tax=Roseofilum sp. Belize BBD 4 TaxID=2821500 RepID=UPI001B10C349|nr:polysaccharide biosynthesis tyrosine autokinase [Roseofilum sp. Belize BBD 4]MBP0032829.1 polysaccharide biosynthesis tyrosine autokinase [Roseofilum sp. Belize BBD 4]
MDIEQQFYHSSTKQNGQSIEGALKAGLDQSQDVNEEEFDATWLFAVLRRRVLAMAGVAFALSVLAGGMIVSKSRNITLEYQGSFRLLVEPPTAQEVLARQFILAQGSNPDVQRASVQSHFLDYETQLRVLRSPLLMEPIVEKIKTRYPETNYYQLISKLKLEQSKYLVDGKQQGTKIIVVSYQDKDIDKIQYILEQISQSFVHYSLQQRLNSLQNSLTFIDEQIPSLQQRVDNLQDVMQQVRGDSNFINPSKNANTLEILAINIEEQRIQVDTQLAQAYALYNASQQQLIAGNPISVLAQDTKVNERLLLRIAENDANLAEALSHFRDDSAPVQILKSQQQELLNEARKIVEERVLPKIEIDIQKLEAQQAELLLSEHNLNQKIKDFALNTRRYNDIERELEIATEVLKEFLSKRKALEIDAAEQQAPWEIIHPPAIDLNAGGQPRSVTETKTKRELALAVVLSSLMGVAVGFLIEVLHTVFHSPDEVKNSTKLPLLSSIPFVKSLNKSGKKRIKILNKAQDLDGFTEWVQPEYSASFLEAFRSLYTNINLLNSKKRPIHSLVISSATVGEGKSTIALQLAQTAAAIGKRVLLVDADLRHPQLHVYLGLNNQRGLSDGVTDYLSLNEVIQQSTLEENLFFLSAGQFTPDPIKLLSSQKMQYLMGQFQGFFDLVIYDTPPLVGLADAHIVAAHADGLVLVVGLEKTDRLMVNQAVDELGISGATVLGVVTNHLKKGGSSKSSYLKRGYASQRMGLVSESHELR